MNELTGTLENIYTSLHNDNDGLDEHIVTLKNSLVAQKMPHILFDAQRIPQPNREGRKLLQSYFKKRGVSVVFSE